MKGVILCGGKGTRLLPLTLAVNKHCLNVGSVPMVYHPINFLKKMGIVDIMIICGEDHAGDFLKLLKDGEDLGVKLTYRVQSNKLLGIPVALNLAKDFVGNEPCIVILGDNFIEDDISKEINTFKDGAMIFLKAVDDPKRFGLAVIKDGKVITMQEKPQKPLSDLAITGIYLFDSNCFDIIPKLKISKRNELEILDVLTDYMHKGKLNYKVLKDAWIDMGTIESLYKANVYIHNQAHDKSS